MNNLNTITSNSLNALAIHLANDIKQSSAAPLSPEIIVVQSSGMSRWINIEIASLNGVCAGIEYKFPNTIIDDIFSKIVPEAVGISPFDPDILSWRIMKVLPDYLSHPEFEPVRSYCNSCFDDRGQLQFSSKVADCFDQYTIYRPEMILEWDRGGGNGWQPLLWRAVSKDFSWRHRASLLKTFKERLSAGLIYDLKFPNKIRLFGVSYLPLYHLEILSLLSKTTEVIIYLLNPCGEYWGDIISRKKLASIALDGSQTADFYETGNPLLSSLGTMGQEFFNMLLDYGTSFETIEVPVKKKYPDSILSLVQSDILHMHDRSGVEFSPSVSSQSDRSVQVHSCHGPLRELQVLYDNLLQMFSDIKDLEPRQIIVMTPDIESYAPYISAVFGTRTDDRPEIPFTIADRGQRCENPEISTFIKILKLPGSRFGINQILELLESDAIMSRFSVSSDEIETIHEWLSATRVRWGIDADHRKDLGFPPYEENSWHAAFNRLLMGYALTPDNGRLFNDIAPLDGIEGIKALTLGKLVYFFNQIKHYASQMAKARTLSEWADTLTVVVKNLMFLTDLTSNNLKPVFEALQKLRDNQELSGFNSEISLAALIQTLSSYLDKPGASFGFMSGKVTFCAMLPMRSIPFRIICMIGMNDSVFPRLSRQPGFSMMSGKRIRGDRSLREEDRYLFLEAIMSADERLFISYTGQSCRDNSEIPPSVVVSELLDYINSGFIAECDVDKTPPPITIRHHLQSFSRSYFSNNSSSPLFSYSQADYLALEARRISGSIEIPFCNGSLPKTETDVFEIDIQGLIRFFSNPAAQFLSLRLGIRPESIKAVAEENESFELNSLDKYNLRQDAVKSFIDGKDVKQLYNSARSVSLLPPLTAGLYSFDTAISEAEIFTKKVMPHLNDQLDPLAVSLRIGEFNISGNLNGIRKEQHLRFRCANIKGKDRLVIWIEHLILNATVATGYPRSSLLICRDTTLALPPLENANEILLDMLGIYQQGSYRPLPFFPESSLRMQLKGLSEAEKCWNGSEFNRMTAEKSDPAYQLCFGRKNPLNEEFSDLSQIIYAPLFKVALEEKQ